MAVEIEDERIVRVWSIDGAQKVEQGRLVDGSGGYLMPGLWDCHVHLTNLGSHSVPLFLAYGITSVRDMGSDLFEVIEWRNQIEAGELIGPRIKTPGQIMESAENVKRMIREQTVEPVERIRIPLAGPSDALPAVRRLAEGGADFIKVRTIPDEATLRALAEVARKFSLKLTGHPIAEPRVLTELGMGSVEHFLTLNPSDSAEQRQNDYRQLLKAGVRIGTTTVNLDNSVLLSYEEIRARLRRDPRMRFVGDYLRRDWEEQANEHRGAEAQEAIESFRRTVPSLYRDLREMSAAGIEFLAGSDAAVLFLHPGSSLHGELENLVRNVGIGPWAALRAATVNPASFFGLQAELGAVKPGFYADLVLLRKDPLKDIANTRRIVGVMARGRWFDGPAIEELKKLAARD